MREEYTTTHAYITLTKRAPNCYNIDAIYVATRYRGEGRASDLLREVCAKADKTGVNLTLTVAPLSNHETAMKALQLIHWYTRHGFIADDHASRLKMIRKPAI